jgi:hypothetical protein
MKNKLRRSIAALMSVAMLATALAPHALAGALPTEAVSATGERERITSVLARADLRARLEALGVSSSEIKARVDALSDKEAAELAAQLDALPAGGDGIIGAIVLVFLVLLLTDIVGLTKVFPFTRSIR